MSNAFPRTQQTHIKDLVLHEDEKSLRTFLQDIYTQPLVVFHQGYAHASLEEASEVVNDFLGRLFERKGGALAYLRGCLDYLAKPDKMKQPSLHSYLINGLLFHVRSTNRREARHQRNRAEGDAVYEVSEEVTSGSRAFDRAVLRSLVTAALERGKALAVAADYEVHYEIFVRHVRDGESYSVLAEEFDVTEAEAATKARTGRRYFKRAFEELTKIGSFCQSFNRALHQFEEILET